MTFTMWSMGHYFFIVSPFIFWAILHFMTRKEGYQAKRKIGIILGVVGVAILVMRNIEIFMVMNYRFDYELIPLQVCHFANFVLLFAFIKNSKPLFAFAWLFNLPAAYMSIVFANGLENYATILSLRGIAYITGHMLIVSLSLWAFSNGFVVLNKKILLKLYMIMLPLYIIAHGINMLFRVLLNAPSNYFYTVNPASGTPLESFYALGTTYISGSLSINPIYLILTAFFGLLVTLVMFYLTKYIQVVEIKEDLVLETI